MNKSLRMVWALFTAAERRKASWTLMLIVAMAGAETAGVVSILPFLSALGRPDSVVLHPSLAPIRHYLRTNDPRHLTVALGLVSMAVVIASSLFKTVTLHLVNRFVHMQRHSLSTRLLSRYLHQPYEFFLTRNPSVLAKNVLSEVDQLVFDVLQPLSQLIAQGAVVLAMIALVVAYDPLMAACIIGMVVLLYGAIYLVVRHRLSHTGQACQTANAERYKLCNEALGGIKEVKVTGTADYFVGLFSKQSREFSRHAATAETLSHSPLYLVEAVGYSGLIAIALTLLVRSSDLGHVLPALGLYGFAAYRMLPAAQIMYRGFARLRFSSAALHNINRDLELRLPPPKTKRVAIIPKHEIRLRAVRYAYPEAPEKWVLDDLELVIPATTSVAITGRSGNGKSTLMDVLLGLLEPQSGALTVDGMQITSDNVAAWQKSIGYVPQHIYLLDASVADNIAFGIPEHRIDMAAAEQAARAAQIHDFVVNELPEGYRTHVGDRGVRLSGGQRQRIGIARALYGDPPVLLLDEATSALDAETEHAFNSVIHGLSGSKTIVVVAHKESALRSCSAIVRLPDRC